MRLITKAESVYPMGTQNIKARIMCCNAFCDQTEIEYDAHAHNDTCAYSVFQYNRRRIQLCNR